MSPKLHWVQPTSSDFRGRTRVKRKPQVKSTITKDVAYNILYSYYIQGMSIKEIAFKSHLSNSNISSTISCRIHCHAFELFISINPEITLYRPLDWNTKARYYQYINNKKRHLNGLLKPWYLMRGIGLPAHMGTCVNGEYYLFDSIRSRYIDFFNGVFRLTYRKKKYEITERDIRIAIKQEQEANVHLDYSII